MPRRFVKAGRRINDFLEAKDDAVAQKIVFSAISGRMS